MGKFSLQKEIRQKLALLEADKRFHFTVAADLENDIRVTILAEAQRTGNKDKKIKHIDLDKGEIEVEDIIIANGNSKIIEQQKTNS